MRPVFALLACLLFSGVVSAQEINLKSITLDKEVSPSGQAEDIDWLHVTPDLISSETGQAALKEYEYLKENGLFPAPKGGSYTLGEKKTFWVLNIRTSIEVSTEFTLMAEESKFNLWVETTQLSTNGGRITSSDINALVNAVGNQTPSGSIDPNKGIVAIDEEVFGPPSDVDGSGKMDVLLHDIQDDYDPANGVFSAVGGFFYPKDLVAPNRQDIIHLDTVPGMYSQNGTPKAQTDLHQTLAHEYEHLIMAANKGSEETFISEGQAEWAEVVTGYTPRQISYFNTAAERSLSFFTWRSNGGPDSEDYQRGGLWTNYLADRLGYETVGKVSLTNVQGHLTYINVLNSLGFPVSILEDFVQGFHVANLINDDSKIPNFGYTTPSRKSLRISNIPEIDGQSAVGSTKTNSVQPGAVVYQQWTNVGSFTLNLDASNASLRSDLRPILIFDESNGTRSFEEFSAGGEGVFRQGNFESVRLVVPHVDLASSSAVSFNYTASWSDYSGSSSFANLVYDTGIVHHQLDGNTVVIIGDSVPSGGNGFFAESDKFANRFDVPAGAALSEVSVSMIYMDHFGQSTSNVRDFKLSIWNDSAGKPGSVLVSDVFSYTGGITAPELSYQTISLAPYQNVLKSASGPLYVSIENAGTDDNYMYFIVAYSNETTSPSFMFNRFGATAQRWASFDALTSGGQPAFAGQVVPIRARIDLNAGSTAITGSSELPERIALSQNFPNPFNPTTSIPFSLPAAAEVRLDVFDLLGRKVATLKNGFLPAGTHSVHFDASRLSSGIYMYSLQAGDSKITRTMTLMK